MKPDVSVKQQFPFSIDKVWASLTRSETLEKWIWPNDFKPVIGHDFQFRGEPNEWWDGIVNCKVLEVNEPHKLSYTWHSAGEETTVVWMLEQIEENQTLLILNQSGFSNETKSTKGAIEGATYSWKAFCMNLDTVLKESYGEDNG